MKNHSVMESQYLSLKEKGLYQLILMLNESGQTIISIDDIMCYTTDRKTSIKRGLISLEGMDFISRKRTRGKDGRLIGVEILAK